MGLFILSDAANVVSIFTEVEHLCALSLLRVVGKVGGSVSAPS